METPPVLMMSTVCPPLSGCEPMSASYAVSVTPGSVDRAVDVHGRGGRHNAVVQLEHVDIGAGGCDQSVRDDATAETASHP